MSKIESFSNDQGISQEILINNVGNQVIKWLKKNITSLNNKKFLILIGKGNNGSDGLTIAKKLLPIVKNVFVAAPIGRSEDNYIKNFISAGGEVYGIKKNINIKAFEEALNTTDIVIDCIFGTGINKSINHPLDIFFNMVNESKKPVIALDIPSGINPNTGENDKNSLKVHTTLMLGFPKFGCVNNQNPKIVGNLQILDIGLSKNSPINIQSHWITQKLVSEMLPKRDPAGYKNIFGNVGIIAGSNQYKGACILTTLGSIYSGVGICTVITNKSLIKNILNSVPEAIFIELPEDDKTQIIDPYKSLKKLVPLFQKNKFSSLVIGPGLSLSKETEIFVNKILEKTPNNIPIIIDADAITIISKIKQKFKDHINTSNIIVTPHIGELQKMTGISKNKIVKNRFEIVKEYAKKERINVVSKGAPTIIASPDGSTFISPWVNSGLSKAGSGDILSGLIGGLAAQPDMNSINASVIGVFIHGLAAENSKKKFGEHSMRLTELTKEIALAFRDIENYPPDRNFFN